MKFSSFLSRKRRRFICRIVPWILTARVSETFLTMVLGKPFGGTLRRNWATECSPGRHQRTRLTLHLGLVLAWARLEGLAHCFCSALSDVPGTALTGREAWKNWQLSMQQEDKTQKNCWLDYHSMNTNLSTMFKAKHRAQRGSLRTIKSQNLPSHHSHHSRCLPLDPHQRSTPWWNSLDRGI